MADIKSIKEQVKIINDSGLMEKAGQKVIRVVGVKSEVLINAFGDAVDMLADKKLDAELPATVIKCYNETFNAETADAAVAAGTEDPAKTTPPADKEAPPEEGVTPEPDKAASKEKKEKKSPAAQKPRSCYGHIASAKSGQLDEMLRVGSTYGTLMKECDVKLHRVKGHVAVLKKKGLTVLLVENKDDPLLTEVSIKEASV